MDQVAVARREIFAAHDAAAEGLPRWFQATEDHTRHLAWEGQELLPIPRVRRLGPEQEAPAEPSLRPTLILGSAGSGKSVVLIERLVRSVQRDVLSGRRSRFLVTTYNKQLVSHLKREFVKRWKLEPDVLDGFVEDNRTRERGAVDYILSREGVSSHTSIRFLNWDGVFTRILEASPFEVAGNPRDMGKHLQAIGTGPATDGVASDPNFLYAEMLRVIWGLNLRDEDEYLLARRRGRRRAIGASQRREVWNSLMETGLRTSMHVRWESLPTVTNVDATEQFDGIFVDEGQDFTNADFQVVAGLSRDVAGVVVAMDRTQAIHLGDSSELPRQMGGRPWQRHELTGSYRLPVRICEAVSPLADRIAAASSSPIAYRPEPRKTGILGARPVIIDGSAPSAAEQVADVLALYESLYLSPAYNPAGGKKVIFAEEGGASFYKNVRDRLRDGTQLDGYWPSMLALKGLEFPAVVWATDAGMQVFDESVDEWVYTILTRPRHLAVVVLREGTPDAVRAAVGSLRADRLLFWSDEARRVWKGWARDRTG
jgi:DNA helicase II / ATP-dependent DNA helicase PcrA